MVVEQAGLAREFARVFEPASFLLERAVLARLQLGAADLVQLEPEEVGTRLQLSPPGLGLLQRAQQTASLGEPVRHFGRPVGTLCERIQYAALLLGVEQGLVVVLAVEVHQRRAQLAHERSGGRRPVNPGAIAPLGSYLALEDEEALFGLHPEVGQARFQHGVPAHVENPLDDRALCARPHDFASRALTQQQRERPH